MVQLKIRPQGINFNASNLVGPEGDKYKRHKFIMVSVYRSDVEILERIGLTVHKFPTLDKYYIRVKLPPENHRLFKGIYINGTSVTFDILDLKQEEVSIDEMVINLRGPIPKDTIPTNTITSSFFVSYLVSIKAHRGNYEEISRLFDVVFSVKNDAIATRLYNTLLKNGINTVDAFYELDMDEFKKMRGIGEVAYDRIVAIRKENK